MSKCGCVIYGNPCSRRHRKWTSRHSWTVQTLICILFLSSRAMNPSPMSSLTLNHSGAAPLSNFNTRGRKIYSFGVRKMFSTEIMIFGLILVCIFWPYTIICQLTTGQCRCILIGHGSAAALALSPSCVKSYGSLGSHWRLLTRSNNSSPFSRALCASREFSHEFPVFVAN